MCKQGVSPGYGWGGWGAVKPGDDHVTSQSNTRNDKKKHNDTSPGDNVTSAPEACYSVNMNDTQMQSECVPPDKPLVCV